MKVVSERLVSRARDCISSVERPRASVKMASGVAFEWMLGEDVDLGVVEGAVAQSQRLRAKWELGYLT